jgi:hypothetical protein
MIILGNLIAVLTTEELNPTKKNEIVDAIKTTLSLEEKDFLLLMGKIGELHLAAEKLMQELS